MTRKEYSDLIAKWLRAERPPTGPAPVPDDYPPEGDPNRALADHLRDMCDPDALSRDIRKSALLAILATWDAADTAGRESLAAEAVRAASVQDRGDTTQ